MTTKKTAAVVDAAEMTELEKLKAELAAARAEADALKAELSSKKTAGRRAEEFPVDQMAAEDTTLGYIQRQHRDNIYDALPKLGRALGIVAAAQLVFELSERVAASTDRPVQDVAVQFTTKVSKPRAQKGEKVVEDSTAPEAPAA